MLNAIGDAIERAVDAQDRIASVNTFFAAFLAVPTDLVRGGTKSVAH